MLLKIHRKISYSNDKCHLIQKKKKKKKIYALKRHVKLINKKRNYFSNPILKKRDYMCGW
jgi:hypothetical protein